MEPGKVRDKCKCLKQQSKNQTNFILVVNETIEVRIYTTKSGFVVNRCFKTFL